jgi:hypothetical protein
MHAYDIRRVREQHYYLVPELFTKVFNLLISWLPDGPKTLNDWRDSFSLSIQASMLPND